MICGQAANACYCTLGDILFIMSHHTRYCDDVHIYKLNTIQHAELITEEEVD